MRKSILAMAIMLSAIAAQAKTLIVYYSYTNNVERIINELRSQIEADVVEIEPADKGVDYAADNYAAGSALIAAIRNNPDEASSYPAIDPVTVDLTQYSTIIIGAPLWWSQMAAPFQTFLFQHGAEMSGKNIGLIVSSASSGITGVESDARRLIPDGNFLSPALWIRSSQTSGARSLLSDWLKAIGYGNISAGITETESDQDIRFTVHTLSGIRIAANTGSTAGLPHGLYVINGKKRIIY